MKLKLQRYHLEIFEECHRDNFDRRKKLASAVFSYLAPNGDEYRRRFNAPIGTPEQNFWSIAPTEIEIKL